jgi:hypothetical protein
MRMSPAAMGIEAVEEIGHAGDDVAQPHAEPHREEYPER